MDLREIGLEAVDWILLAEVRDRWRAFVNTVMNALVPLKAKFSWLSECTVSSLTMTVLSTGI
jgi:hypothetical protein